MALHDSIRMREYNLANEKLAFGRVPGPEGPLSRHALRQCLRAGSGRVPPYYDYAARLLHGSDRSPDASVWLDEHYLGFAIRPKERSALDVGRWVRKSACGSRDETRPAPIQAYRLIKAPMTKQTAAA
jgi:hypothetical protein